MLTTVGACALVALGHQADPGRPHYVIAATIAADGRSLTGRVTIRPPAGNDGPLRLGISRIRVARVSDQAGATLVPAFDADSSVMTVAASAAVVVEFAAAGDNTARRQFGYELYQSTGPADAWYPFLIGYRFADFEVKLDHPAGLAVLTTGGSGRDLGARGVEGFALAFGPDAVLTRVSRDGLTVIALSPPSDTATFREVAAATLRAAAWYRETYGGFPVDRIGIVPGYIGARGGFPLPNMFMIHRGDLSPPFVRWITAHELAHYYWGLSVLDAEERLGWLMLALGIWTDQLYLARTAGVSLAEAWRDPRGDDSFGDFAEAILAGYDQRLGLPAATVDSLEYDYNSLVRHGKAATGVYLLALRLGEERFIQLQKKLLRDWTWKPLSVDAFGVELEAAGLSGARNFLAAWVRGDASLGYRIAGIDPAGTGSWKIRVRRTGTVPFPVSIEAVGASGERVRASLPGADLDSVVVSLGGPLSGVRIDPDGVLPMQSSDHIGMRRVFVRAEGAVGPTPLFVERASRHLESDPDPYVAAQLIERLFESGRYGEAIGVSSRVPAIRECTDRQTCLAAIQVARGLARSGHRAEATELFRKIEGSMPAYGRAAGQRVQLLRQELVAERQE